ncbi:hypothetical protein [Petrachloros mirabilis]
MAVLAGNVTSIGNPLESFLLFARQPEPDLEFTEDELDQTTATKPVSPMKPAKKPGGGRSLFWILLLVLVAAIGYVAMDPAQLTEWLAPIMGEPTPAEAPQLAMKPRPAITPPDASAPRPAPSDTLPEPSAVVPPTPTTVEPPPAGQGTPAIPLSEGTPTATKTAKLVPTPMFAEGQKVAVIGNPTMPSEAIPLLLDPAGTQRGPEVRPTMTLTILDGDLQPSGWVYLVRAEDGKKGWIGENRLRPKF